MASIAAVSADDGNMTIGEGDIQHNTIHVSNGGRDDNSGDEQSPYATLGHAVSSSPANSTIILHEGTYKGILNTQININGNLTIEGEGNAIIDGENRFSFFKISSSACLTLKNIKFVNGFTDSYSQLAIINNNGNLKISDCSFDKMNSVMGTIFNQKNLDVVNTTITNSKSKNMAQVIVNLGECTIIDSKLTTSLVYSNQDVSSTVYNYRNLNIHNSRVDEIESNSKYDDFSYTGANIFIDGASIDLLEVEEAAVSLSNSRLANRAGFRNSQVNISKSQFNQQSSYSIGLSVYYCNFTAIHSTFSCDISSGYSNLNITYCAILANMYGGGKYDYLYAPYNWWGINSGPSLSYFNNYNVSYWAVATFEYENASIPINPTGEFTVTLNRWSDGVNTYGFSADEYLPLRYVSFESQSGKFASSYKALDKITNNYLIGNTVDGKVYAVIDRQRLVLNVGNAISEYTYYLSPDGHDGPEDGTYEKPFLTLQYALSRVGNGNTLCILGGINKNPADSDVTITKNITIIGFNDTVLVRSNSFSMFNIKEWGSLTIKNIHFTVSDREYDDPIFLVSGGNLRIVNSTFTNITSAGVVYTSGGIENRGTVVIEDSRFSDIKGSAISGVAKSFIINTSFERFTNYYTIVGLESYNCIFPVTSPIEIYDSTFKNNQIGIVNLHPYYYSRSALLGVPLDYADEYGLYAYVENSLFENNVFAGSDSYSSSGTGFLIHDDYGSFSGFINNCSFIGNQGPICIANSVSNSIFIENTDPTYRSSALVRAGEIYDCRFTKNTNLHKDGDGAFVGEGIASANSILNSTFEYNRAAFGGAVANTFEIHYCAFVNNTALYGGNDIFSASGNVDYSTNWWGDNQKPGSDKIYKFLGTLTVSDWIIMSVEYSSNKQIRASLTRCVDDYGNIRQISNFNQKRLVLFEIDNGEISPENITMNNGVAYAVLNCNFNNDFKAYARIDNQLMEVNVRNTHTDIIADDVTFKGRDNRYSITLQNVNGFKISNQTLLVEVSDETSAKTFTLSTDDNGHAEFNVDYPVGKYSVEVKYLGNGYFTKSSASAIIEIVISPTILVSYNHTYYGKTNRFSAILTGENDNKLRNLTLTFTVFNSNGQLRVINVVTDNYGVGEALLTLDTGEYTVLSEFRGNSWYSYSNATSHIVINPANTTIVVPSITLYGEGNLYNITLKDVYGNRIRDENVFVTITQGAINDRFTLKTNELGVASLTINYLPGTYNIQVEYIGDEVYGSSLSTGIIKIEKVLTVLSGFYHATIPVNGIYTVVLSDMYGKRINGETITLSLYQGELVKQYSQTCDANGEASFRIDMGEGNYLATMDYGGSLWYEDSTGAATIVVSNDVAPQDIFINASDLVQYYGENKFFIIRFNDPNAYSQYGKTITATLSSGTWSSTYNLNTDVYGLARLKITLNPGEYDITYKYSNTYYNLFASGSNKISVFKTPTRIFANDLVIKKDESRILDIGLRDVNNSPIRNMQILVDIDGKISQNLTTNTEGIAKLLLNLDVGEHIVSYSISNPNYLPSNGSSRVLVVDSDKISSNIISHDAVSFDNQTLDFKIQLTDELNVGISSSRVMIGVFDFDGESILNKTGFTSSDGNLTFNLNLGYGSYLVNVAYEGNDLYLPSSNVNTVIVESADNKTKTVLLKGEDQLLSSTDYYVVLSDVNGTLLKNKEIRFILDGREYITATDANARAYLNVTLAPDVYTVKAVFDGDDDYKRSSVMSKIYISGRSTQLHVSPLVKYYLNGTQFHARLVDALSHPVCGKIVSVILQ
uniref:Ig-like domain repeat protein n=1 Tax=Methanobrevibacter sp. TaxID=66852 RepID=UPI0038672D36